jgi:endonuclease/exonuclease/phosphatase family metal-dependent hydrolase
MQLHCALLNLENGALVKEPDTDDVCQARKYDFGRLRRLIAPAVERPPHVVALNEAKEFATHGRRALNCAAEVLSTTLGRRYVGLPGWLPVGPFGPALFYDACTLVLDYWGDDHPTVPLDKRNLGRLHVFGKRGTAFEVLVDHWPFWSGEARLERARYIAGYGRSTTPLMLVGDLNETASGLHLPQRDWYARGITNRHHKGKEVDGVWQPWTDGMDLLIGRWRDGARESSEAGFFAAEEVAGVAGPQAEAALMATVNTGVDKGGGLLIDWVLPNAAWRDGVVPGSVQVHIPPAAHLTDSNHRLKTWTMLLDAA